MDLWNTRKLRRLCFRSVVTYLCQPRCSVTALFPTDNAQAEKETRGKNPCYSVSCNASPTAQKRLRKIYMSAAIFCDTRRDVQVALGSKKLAAIDACGARVRPASATTRHYAARHGFHKWLDAGSVALHFVSARAIAWTPTKRPALRLRGARRTSLRSPCAPHW